MPLDLNVKPKDHPANLLRAEAAVGSQTEERKRFYRECADFLETFEAQHGLTFLTGDNKTLEAIQEAYGMVGITATASADFVSETRDLLGLD